MKPLDNLELWLEKLNGADATNILSDTDRIEWNSLSRVDREAKLTALLQKPVADFSVVYRWYFRMKWAQALDKANLKKPVALLEIGAGDTDMLPQILARKYEHPETQYITANKNKKLTASFKDKTKELPVKINVIEDAAQNLEAYMKGEKFDVIVFEHSINDILQTILGERAGIDTTHSDWYTVLPQMIELIKQEYLDGTLEASVKDELLDLLKACMKQLKPGGYIVINHFMYQYDLDLGYHPDLWNNMLNITREWIKTIEDGAEEIFEGFDRQWWMFLGKNKSTCRTG
ncbi:MAG: hypothetical protein K0R50_2392 [Eubacterium sp.]|nr:hypothetical protein [Eubacterium sp.]